MPMNTDIDTTGLERIERPTPRGLPPLSLDSPTKSPFYVSQLPGASAVGADVVNNFRNNGIPSYRISPPPPLTMAGAGSNAIPTVAVSSFNILQPPSPTISQSLTATPTGYSFSFSQVRLPLGSSTSISTYKVYRASTSSNTNAQVIQTISHNQSNAGVPIVVQDSQPNGSTFFYFVSAVSTAGIESSLTPAQAQGVTVTNNSGFDGNSRLASSFHNTAVNTAFAPTSTSTLSNNGLVQDINIAASTNQFAPGGVTYSSGTVSVPSFGTFYVFADDPLFLGGAVIYQFTSIAPFSQVGSEGRLPWGKIHTASSVASSGGGYSGGSTGSGAGGGRGYIQ
jgi:hypothetical protein